MASVVVKTIWQSKEIHEAGDPPVGVESRAQLVPEAPGGVTSPTKGITKKKKAVSFHGVEPRMSKEPMHWCLNLKQSSACTNLTLLNLAAMEPDSSGTDSTTEDSGPLALPGPPASPITPWAPEDPDITELLSGVNSGLVCAKDSITNLKEKTTRVNQHVQTLQSECSVLSENLERRRQEAEELEGYCSQLKVSRCGRSGGGVGGVMRRGRQREALARGSVGERLPSMQEGPGSVLACRKAQVQSPGSVLACRKAQVQS
ncbi:testis-specific serine kinase substrate [Peromyscus californicus insignis]|uniref:testis-specific serine kinase substrate n=1 Tax=Peromyscus californicus insignis TaxID=564181 RepID=UPI0022A7FE1A|nr:testis-specific serine kinase substrate [Peromyscus californicus insignis]